MNQKQAAIAAHTPGSLTSKTVKGTVLDVMPSRLLRINAAFAKAYKNIKELKKMHLNELQTDIHNNAIVHGWWDSPRTFGDHIALCHTELSEAFEEERNNRPDEYFIDKNTGEIITDMSKWNGEKTEGRAVEQIDCLIRILDWCGANNIDTEAVINRKHAYNKTRSYKHGNKKL